VNVGVNHSARRVIGDTTCDLFQTGLIEHIRRCRMAETVKGQGPHRPALASVTSPNKTLFDACLGQVSRTNRLESPFSPLRAFPKSVGKTGAWLSCGTGLPLSQCVSRRRKMVNDELFNKTDHPTDLYFRHILPVCVHNVIADFRHSIQQLRGAASDQTGRLDRAYDL
jgi:hypothetical protein